MPLPRISLVAATCLSLVLTSRPAQAWDSICYKFADPTADASAIDGLVINSSRGCQGIEAARARWRDPIRQLDEHRQLFVLAVLQAGLPATLLETQKLAVFVRDQQVTGNDGATSSVMPRELMYSDPSFAGIKGAQRAFSLDELAQLPDFSYGLWDWASGNETCPLDIASTPQACHAFKTHMGATNANHFPPQSDAWYRHYHDLAMTRARVCTANRTAARQRAQARGEAPAQVDDNLRETWKACEVEALAYEAVAQHYLQDSWSAGHMWERWGSSDLNQITDLLSFPSIFGLGWDTKDPTMRRMLIAETVAAVAGSIHGADPAFIDFFNVPVIGPVSIATHDPMCYPDVDVQAFDGTSWFNVVGDLHAHDAIPSAISPTHDQVSNKALDFDRTLLDVQGQRLLGCTAGSLGEVYGALVGSGFQPVLGDAPTSAASFDADACIAPRVTNLAFFRGLFDREVDIDLFGTLEFTRQALGNFAVTITGPLAATLETPPPAFFARARADYLELTTKAALRAKQAPMATDMSYPPPFLGVQRNGANPITPSPDLADPVPVAGDSFGASGLDLPMGSYAETKPFYLTNTFHHSRTPEVCERQLEPQYRVDLKKILRAARADIEATPPTTLAGQQAREAVCRACAEWVGPFIWNTNSWNGSRLTGAPLCSYSESYPQTKTMTADEGGGWGLDPDTVLTNPKGTDTRWFAHYPTQNSHSGADPIPIGYESPLSYVGGRGDETPEELAKLMCCARLDTGGGTGNFRLHGKLTGQPLDSTVTLFLTSAAAPSIEADDLEQDYEQPVLAHLPGSNSTTGARALAAAQAERFGLRYDTDPLAKAVFDTAKAVTEDDGHGYEYNFGNTAKNWLPAAGTFRLTPLMAMDEKRGEHCTFDPPSRLITLGANRAEDYEVDFAMDCSASPTFDVGYRRPFRTAGTVRSTAVTTPDGDKQWVYAQRVFVNGPVELQQLGLVTPTAGASTVRMAVYKETGFSMLTWTATAALVTASPEQGPAPGQSMFAAGGLLDKGAYWIVTTFTGSADDTTIGFSAWRFGYGFGAAYLIPRYAAFTPQLSLGVGDFRDWRLNVFMKVH